jgi:dienelactone hydrolase
MGLIQRLSGWWKRIGQAISLGRRAWRGAAWGGLAVLSLMLLVAAHGLLGAGGLGWFAIGALFLIAVFALAGGLVTLVWRVVSLLPGFYAWVAFSTLLLLAFLALTAMSVPVGVAVAGLGALAAASLLGAGVAVLVGGGWPGLTRLQRVVAAGGLALGLAGLIAGGTWMLDPGAPLPDVPNAALAAGAEVEPLDLPDPARPGPYGVRTLTYGSGEDRRPEYGGEADLVTEPVDGSALVEGWSALRTAYWGFGPEALPLNGRVWYPEPAGDSPEGGSGPYPLVLVVHGQHPMEDVSDGGYAYLGNLLASRGFIVASVDENFLNLSPLADLLVAQSLVGPDDLRGWLLLEHLNVWRGWNGDPDAVFYQKVDLDKVALIGHSRGGQAVAAAAAFNELPAYPDDASVRFDYGFGIRSVVAFAPVDGGYKPAGQDIALENVNYLVLHGSHDMDVFTFQGDRQYSRVAFSDAGEGFKSAIYIHGANHGQFNTSWGRKDLFEPIMRLFNLEQLMPGEEQRRVAKVTISAFLEATLRDDAGYRALFQDLRRGRAWLPETIVLHQYQDAATQLVATYEEDADVASTTLPGGRIRGENLTVWREQPAAAKWEDLGDQTAYVGWDGGATASPAAASYTIEVPSQGLVVTEESVLVFSLADANEDPRPEGEGGDVTGRREPIDLTVEVVDEAGEAARLPLSRFSLLQPQLEGRLGKARFFSPFPTSEPVLQHFAFGMEDFVAINPAFEPARLAEVRWVFDRTDAGVVVLDNVGIRE